MNKPMTVLAVFFLLSSVLLMSGEAVLLKVKTQLANVREEPVVNSTIVTTLKKGTEIAAIGKVGSWYELSILNKSGDTVTAYIHSGTVEVISGKAEAAEEEELPKKAVKPRKKIEPEDEEEEEEIENKPVRRRKPAMRSSESKSGGMKLIGGLNFNRLTFQDPLPEEIKQKSTMGFLAGVGFEFGSGSIGFELDALISKGGSSFVPATGSTGEKIVLDGFGLYIPLLLKIRLMPQGGVYLVGGGTVGYLISQKFKYITATETTEQDVADDVNRICYGVTFGGGYEMPMGSSSLLIEGRYNLGLSNWIKEPQDKDYVRSNIIELILGIKF
jgi:hypothetical protein